MAQLSPAMRALVQPHLVDIEPYDLQVHAHEHQPSANETPIRCLRACAMPSTQLSPQHRSTATQIRFPASSVPNLLAGIALSPSRSAWATGANELLFNVMLAFGGRGRALVTCPPDFQRVRVLCLARRDRNDIRRSRSPVLRARVDDLVRAAQAANLVIVTSPNNPPATSSRPMRWSASAMPARASSSLTRHMGSSQTRGPRRCRFSRATGISLCSKRCRRRSARRVFAAATCSRLPTSSRCSRRCVRSIR